MVCGTQVLPETRGLSSSSDIDALITIERLGHSAHCDLSDGEQKEIRRPLNPKTEELRWRENPLDSSLE